MSFLNSRWCTLFASLSFSAALLLSAAPAVAARQNTGKSASAEKGSDADVTAIEHMLDVYTAAWNRYDAHTMAMMFSEDCDYVVVGGVNTHGREALEKMLASNFASNLKNSTRTDDVSRTRVRFVTKDLASLDEFWTLEVPGTDRPHREGYYHWILVRQPDGRWLIVLHHAAQFLTPVPAAAK